MIQVHRAVAIIAAIACPAFLACKSNNGNANDTGAAAPAAATPTNDTTTAASTTPTDTANKMASGAMNDANILAKAHIGDSAEVALAKYVASNSTNAGVKAYAHTLERDHSKGMNEVEATAKKLNLTMQPPANDTTTQAASHALDQFKSLKGKDLDTAFVNHEIADHQQDINDAQQMQNVAQAPEVKSLLQKELPELQKHLDAAQKLQSKLSGAGATGMKKR